MSSIANVLLQNDFQRDMKNENLMIKNNNSQSSIMSFMDEFFNCARRGDTAACIDIIEHRVNKDNVHTLCGSNYYSSCTGGTALHVVCYYGISDCIKILIEKGADANFEDECGRQVLSLACIGGRDECIRLLLKYAPYIDVNFKGKQSCTALYFAALNNNEKCMKLLLENGADSNAKDINGLTVLHMATRHNNENSVKVLLEYGADINLQHENGFTALHWATSSFNADENIVKLLMDGNVDLQIKDNEGFIAEELAVKRGRLDIVNFMASYRLKNIKRAS